MALDPRSFVALLLSLPGLGAFPAPHIVEPVTGVGVATRKPVVCSKAVAGLSVQVASVDVTVLIVERSVSMLQIILPQSLVLQHIFGPNYLFALFEVSFLDEKLSLTIELPSEETALVVIAIREIMTSKHQFVIKIALLNDDSVTIKQFSFSLSLIVLPHAFVNLPVRIAINT